MKYGEFAGLGRVQLSNEYNPGPRGGWEIRARKVTADGTVLREMKLLTFIDPENDLEVLADGFLDEKFNVLSKNGKMIVKVGEKIDMSSYGVPIKE